MVMSVPDQPGQVRRPQVAGHNRAHWHCRCTPQTALSAFMPLCLRPEPVGTCLSHHKNKPGPFLSRLVRLVTNYIGIALASPSSPSSPPVYFFPYALVTEPSTTKKRDRRLIEVHHTPPSQTSAT